MKFDKSFLKSKTLYASLAVIIAGFFPAVKDLIKPENTEAILGSIGALFGVLRIFSTKKLVVTEEPKKLV